MRYAAGLPSVMGRQQHANPPLRSSVITGIIAASDRRVNARPPWVECVRRPPPSCLRPLCPRLPLGPGCYTLRARPASAEQQVQNHDQQNETQTAAAVISDAGAHVVAAAAEQKQENNEDD